MCTTSKQIMGWTLGLIQKQQTERPVPSNGFVAAVLQKGGAEGWVQVELNGIYNTLPGVAWVQREQPIFTNPREKVDFLIKCQAGPTTCVELKVESLFNSADEGRATMPHTRWQVVNDDVLKLRDQRSLQYQHDAAYVVAIVWSSEATAGMNEWLRGAHLTHEREEYPVVHDNERWTVTVYVITI
jgi:hypothetical protein